MGEDEVKRRFRNGKTVSYFIRGEKAEGIFPPMDKVNHPSHYNAGKIECIEFIEDQRLGFHLGNAVKYIVRAGKKDPEKTVEDLEKAIWYIRRHLEALKPEGERRRPNEMPQGREK